MAKITGIRCIRTRRNGSWLIMKVLTDQPGLYGLGSLNDIMHYETVQKAVEEGIAPLVIGEEAGQIENLWQRLYVRDYARNGPVLTLALGGLDLALWDIMGKEAGMPVYRLLGGPCRAAVPCYAHASGDTLSELEEDVRRYLEEGYRHVRCQLGPYGGGGFIPIDQAGAPKNRWPMESAFDDEEYLENVPKMFEYLRSKLGFGPKLTHDVHEHLQPHNAVALAKLLEPYRLFFLEDNLPPEQIAWYRLIRQQCTTPQAIGEIFSHPLEWQPLIAERLIDYVRVRVSRVGGITPCRKIGALCEAFGVHTAFQEGGDNDPVNQAAAMHLDMALYSFGIQEENHFRPEELDAFPGHAVLDGGYLYPNDNPGLGIDIDEDKAAALLGDDLRHHYWTWPGAFMADGTAVRP